MLIQRLREPSSGDTIYHYCSAQTFLNIVQNKTIRFSDANLLNDDHEVRWGYSIFIEATNQLLKREGRLSKAPVIPRNFFDKIDEVWGSSALTYSNFVACFSSDGDSLSQWRAYADDGRGVAIGFDVEELRRLPVQIYDILYDRDKQIEEMVDILGASFMEFQSKGLKVDDKWLVERSIEIAASSIAFKNPSWRNENEARCHHVVDVNIGKDGWTLTDSGGISDGVDVGGQPVQFQARNASIVPFLDMPIEVSGQHRPIREVVLGPRYQDTPGAILFLLGNAGYGNIPIKRAGSRYR